MPSNVDLPQPDGPINTTVSPSAMSSSIPSRASTEPYRWETFSMCSGIGRPIAGSHRNQDRTIGDLLAFLDGDRFDLRVERRLELMLDLHGLEHDQGLAARDAVAGRHLDGNDATVHQRAQLAVAAGHRRRGRRIGLVAEAHGERVEI